MRASVAVSLWVGVSVAARLLVGVPAAAAPIAHGPAAVTDNVLAAEKAYSDRFAATTIAAGMREYIADDGLAFTGIGDPARGPAQAFAAYGGNAPSTLRLTWVPSEVFAATSGEMAATWGRFTLNDTAPGAKMPPVTGRYVTVWHKSPAGKWQAIMDIGNPDPPPEPPQR